MRAGNNEDVDDEYDHISSLTTWERKDRFSGNKAQTIFICHQIELGQWRKNCSFKAIIQYI